MTTVLEPEHFKEFFHAVNGVEPYTWQSRLVAEAADRRSWPQLFDLPTGSGKTSIIDAAIFLLALDAHAPASERWMPRRVIMIVDRRIVVDQATDHARRLRAILADSPDPTVARVRDLLFSLTGTSPADGRADDMLSVAALRGGVVRDDTWIRRPDQPAVVTSTVDQVGSRLLFQGYGVSAGMRPIHAGLLGNDALLILDEVHVSQAFAETLRVISTRYQRRGAPEHENRWHVVELSATPSSPPAGTEAGDRWVLRLDPLDLEGPVVPGGLRQRLVATKPARLHPVKTPAASSDRSRKALAKVFADQALAMFAAPHIGSVAVVVNRVATALAVHERLQLADVDTMLLTGRMRSLERDQVVPVVAERLLERRRSDGIKSRLVVVATQCIEVGADFDFDGLVTEVAPVDSLRQRFGRLDRAGTLTADETPSAAVVVGPSASTDGKVDDPIYGAAAAETWSWLQSVAVDGVVDFGVTSLKVPPDGSLRAPADRAPLLLASHLDVWAETPIGRGSRTPPVAPWLHGLDTEEDVADMQVIWRADVTRSLLEAALKSVDDGDSASTVAVVDILSFCRPLSTEALAVPIQAVRRWLAAEGSLEELSDLEMGKKTEGRERLSDVKPFVVWAGDESFVSTDRTDLRPGATIVVPSSYGGMSAGRFGEVDYAWWDPNSDTAVTDLGDRAHETRGGQRVIRLLPSETPGAPRVPWSDDLPYPAERDDDVGELEHLRPWLATYGAELGLPEDGAGLRILEFSRHEDDQTWYGLSDPRRGRRGFDIDTEPATSSFTGALFAPLDRHLDGVGERARSSAQRCGLPRWAVDDLELAGKLHDLGKADERFQAWLRDGAPLVEGQELLAKSATPAFDRRAREASRRRSGYPQGARHEALSLALIDRCNDLALMAHDWDLVRHLVVSHHGWARPFVPPVVDDSPVPVAIEWQGISLTAGSDHDVAGLDFGASERFWNLIERYGWFRLAWFESFLRLADHRQSEAEQRGHGQ